MSELAALVRERAKGRCEYCLLPESSFRGSFHVEHIVARQHGGATDVDNLAFAGGRCNLKKGPNLAGLDPADRKLTGLFNPRTQSWSNHFEIFPQSNGLDIRGKTAIGRATVHVLGLNDEARIAVRANLRKQGVWPS